MSQKPWSISKLEIRAPQTVRAWPLARVELVSDTRGRVADMASAAGPLEAVLAAVAQIVGVDARVDALEIRYIPQELAARAPGAGDGTIFGTISLHLNGATSCGAAWANDVLICCVEAYLDAVETALKQRGQICQSLEGGR